MGTAATVAPCRAWRGVTSVETLRRMTVLARCRPSTRERPREQPDGLPPGPMVRSLPYLQAMKIHSLLRPVSVLALGAATLTVMPRVARAGISACGNIDVRADAHCELVAQSACTTKCTDTSFEQCCAAKLEAECNTQCDATADASCTSSCESDCSTKCTPSPGSFDCDTDCGGRCKASCSGSCSSSNNQTDCEASCGACCNDHCDTKCTAVPPSDDCTTKCNTSCSATCTAQANASCQVQCQAASYPQCKNAFVRTCTTQCNQPEGGLFCDGNYVDVGGNLVQCVDALNAILTSKIEITASGTTTCQGNQCSGSGTAKASCAASPTPAPGGPLAAFGALLGVGIAAAARRRSRR